MFERRVVPPYGLQGGEDGAPFRVTIARADGSREDMPGKANLRLDRDDVVIVESCGGGGYGQPETDEPVIDSSKGNDAVKVDGKKAIVTGAAKGMGAAITTTLAREGADVVLTARDTAPLEEVADEVRALGRAAHVVGCDVTDDAQVKAMVDRALAAFDGRIDILVNIAGVTGPIETPVQDIDVADFDYVIRNNEIGTFLPIKYVVPTMIAQKSGKIVNIGGTSGLRGYAMRTAYSASKWAVRGITRTVALEVGKHNVNVNAVCPGIVETPAHAEALRREGPRARLDHRRGVRRVRSGDVPEARDHLPGRGQRRAVHGERGQPPDHRPGHHGRRRLGRVARPKRETWRCTRPSNWTFRRTWTAPWRHSPTAAARPFSPSREAPT